MRFEKPAQNNIGYVSHGCRTSTARAFPCTLMYFGDLKTKNPDSLSHVCKASVNIVLTPALALFEAYLFPEL